MSKEFLKEILDLDFRYSKYEEATIFDIFFCDFIFSVLLDVISGKLLTEEIANNELHSKHRTEFSVNFLVLELLHRLQV
tara:strand:+ start:7041 stop:7277 length:237 start_codon:yes stop_codon:yes gene_type:complete